MGNIHKNYQKIENREDKVIRIYKKGTSMPIYIAHVYEENKKISKKFKSREEANNWKKYVRDEINKGNKELIFKIRFSF
jgi:hypothetical protein